MIPFRDKDNIPEHQKDRKECEHYSSYLDSLERDFKKRCGYCNDINSYKIRSFTIDHFVPRNPKDFTHDIKPNFYFNLVYSCNYCNSSKSNKWPTKNAAIANNGKEGFVNPTDSAYDNLFYRDIDGAILPLNGNSLSVYIINELNLKNPIHSLMWRLEKLVYLTDKVIIQFNETNNKELIEIKNELLEEYYKITKSIFKTND